MQIFYNYFTCMYKSIDITLKTRILNEKYFLHPVVFYRYLCIKL